MLPGLINCHAHSRRRSQRGFNEDFGFPDSYASPFTISLFAAEATLMAVVGALEAISTGTHYVVENAGGTARYAAALAATGLRWVFAESIRHREKVAGRCRPEGLAKSETPRFSAKMREEGLQRIADLHSAWHGKKNGRISVFPAAGSPRIIARVVEGRPGLRREARPRLHDSPVAEHPRVTTS